jgi:hypothetical protein
MTTQTRAKVGGEIGANGEFYEGGKFIATKDNAKGTPAKKVAKARKVQTAPYQWEMQPAADVEPLFRYVGWALRIASFDYDTKTCALALNDCYIEAPINQITAADVAKFQSVADRFNAGERWE